MVFCPAWAFNIGGTSQPQSEVNRDAKTATQLVHSIVQSKQVHIDFSGRLARPAAILSGRNDLGRYGHLLLKLYACSDSVDHKGITRDLVSISRDPADDTMDDTMNWARARRWRARRGLRRT